VCEHGIGEGHLGLAFMKIRISHQHITALLPNLVIFDIEGLFMKAKATKFTEALYLA
jgi:hypothetical protein